MLSFNEREASARNWITQLQLQDLGTEDSVVASYWFKLSIICCWWLIIDCVGKEGGQGGIGLC